MKPLPLVVAAMAAGCAVAPETGTARDNFAPVAALRAPVIAPVGAPVVLDASRSFDPDADPLTFVFEITGAEAVTTSDRVIEHLFTSEGLFTVRVRVTDLHGAEAYATLDVRARAEYPSPPDFCATAADCVSGTECDAGVCFDTDGID